MGIMIVYRRVEIAVLILLGRPIIAWPYEKEATIVALLPSQDNALRRSCNNDWEDIACIQEEEVILKRK